ncbi:hypothetical protein H112_07519 [Trichophyton rubrum D6]|uniref:DUF1690 domain-containing protein n=4 Tax=Trichophyton TaxID=5550 RepID=F2SDZ2_TRIRC|nr:uncharacterized protein TERG_00122 [Trichophyton rubrum CBS 118892]XP_047605011.1 uncharacterized protein TERG_00122 [Trichophyton rubrum CBS 118892]EZF11327.1 hypothetical protein H100_07545 [Trichophyton rubrum MR850]EZF38151.1 hypothetical protein H102_07508 [Trichophyton rubrum CBS 100081]EZF48863.1 hypothetical protein H103_07532 [Trichophyton rubrum CBS 288.86]EZF59496.1 hypothetical protein H104_07479 [Trichophyton rubrum CBS 289.86]EZF70007.1 hypothetical protein H105_07536 [Tricho
MGAGTSKPADSEKGGKHVFSSNSPVQFSQVLVESLQSSSETDASRSQSLELHIQARVAEELNRIRERETQTLADIEKRIAASYPSEGPATAKSNISTLASQPLSLESPRVPFAGTEFDRVPATSAPAESSDEAAAINPKMISSGRVAKEIEALRESLASRPTIRKLDPELETAREGVVKCLRDNQKRPLDCWQEVDTFKREVARLEKEWVQKMIS